jgi:hypothetical protein
MWSEACGECRPNSVQRPFKPHVPEDVSLEAHASESLWVTPQDDVSATTSHVGGNGHRRRQARLSYHLCVHHKTATVQQVWGSVCDGVRGSLR